MDQHNVTRRRAAQAWRQTGFLLLGVMSAASAQAAPHFVTFVNDSDRTVTSIETAPAGTRHWHTVDLGGPMIGGKSGEIAVRFDSAEVCKQDLAVTYRGIAPLTITGFDVCRNDHLYLGKALAKAVRAAPSRRH